MKFIFLADTHLRSSTPACRTDTDFYSVQMDKLKQVVQIANDQNVDYVFHGGDLFDSHDPSLRLIYDTIQVLKTCKAKLILLPGNHDIFGETTETLYRSGLGILSASGLAQVIEKPVDLELGNAVVRFIPRTSDLDLGLFTFKKKEEGKIYVVVPHAMLTPREVPYPHILVSSITTNSDLVMCSDYHGQFREKHGSTTFINSGPMTIQRVTERIVLPSVAYIDSEARFVDFVRLRFSSVGDVMDLTGEEKESDNVSEEFLASLRSAVFESTDRGNLVREVGTKGGFSSTTIEKTVGRVQEVNV